MKTILFKIEIKNKKNLVTNLIKEVRDLYTEIYKTLKEV